MADIRINALATTAASTASDDFVAVDGSANGTRKLNAFSPTVGGNLTVSGDASVGTSVFKIDSTNTRIVLGLASALQGDTLEIQSKSNAGAISLFGRASDNQSVIAFRSNGSNTQKASIQGGDAGISLVTGLTAKLSIDSAGATTLAGNLTVSGSGPHSFSGRISVTNASGAYAGSFINTDATTAPGLYVQASRTTDSALLVRNASDSSDLLRVTNSGGTVIGGNLTVSGTGTSSVAGTLNVSGGFILNRINAKGIYTGTSDNCGFTWTGTNGEFSTASGSLILKSAGTTALTLDSSQNATFAGSVKAASQVYAEKSGAGIAGQSVGLVTQFTTVNSTTYSVTTAAAKVFVVQLGSGDAALCYTSYKSSTITILGSDGTIVNSNSPSSTQLGIWKGANDHVIYFVTGSNALAGSYGSWGFCFLGNPVISIA